jgi:hypothetical protein
MKVMQKLMTLSFLVTSSNSAFTKPQMTYMRIKLIVAILALSAIVTSCSRSLDNPNNVVVDGTWRVTLFTDSGNDETADFAGYSFTFSNNGTVTATKTGASKNGTWSTGSNKFNIDLGPKVDTNKPLGELTDDWKIITSSATELKLTDDNAASNEFLTFTKN